MAHVLNVSMYTVVLTISENIDCQNLCFSDQGLCQLTIIKIYHSPKTIPDGPPKYM